jgi:hypothetical protein
MALNIQDGSKIDQMDIKFTNIFHCKTHQNLPKLGFLGWKYTIWQPCLENITPDLKEWDRNWREEIFFTRDRLRACQLCVCPSWHLSNSDQIENAHSRFREKDDRVTRSTFIQGCQMIYFLTKTIPICQVYFGGPWNGKCWYILCPFEIFYGHLVHVSVIW